MSFNVRNNGENTFVSNTVTSGIHAWSRRSQVAARVLRREDPTVACLQVRHHR
jgi:hypothetical protein